MKTKKQKRAFFKEILDRLGPGLWLHVEHFILVAVFGSEATVKAAKKFAYDNECAFRYEPGQHYGDGFGVFGRAYSKKIDDVP
ncbi:MAG: hypothetical protein IH901_05195 [Proteobacteria bacterium]|nr:hypothetical protein [Pseudomonadota bacterium]